jgi:putative membrane protein insertion efficiency factor
MLARGGSKVKAIFLKTIRLYQLVISPVLPKACRFYPSCSEYAWQAVNKFGSLKGAVLALKRVFRCHPWGDGGVDQIP